MPVYAYMAMDAKGQNITGALPAQSRSAALNEIARKGLIPVKVDERTGREEPAAVRRVSAGRVPQAASEAFTRELSNLLGGRRFTTTWWAACRWRTR